MEVASLKIDHQCSVLFVPSSLYTLDNCRVTPDAMINHKSIYTTLLKQNRFYFVCTYMVLVQRKMGAGGYLALCPSPCLAAKPQSHDTKIPCTLHQLYWIYIFSAEFFSLCNSSFVKSHNVFSPVFLSPWLYEKSHVKWKWNRPQVKKKLKKICLKPERLFFT